MPKFKLNYASNYVTIKGTAEADSVDTVRKALPSAVIKEQAPRKPRAAKLGKVMPVTAGK